MKCRICKKEKGLKVYKVPAKPFFSASLLKELAELEKKGFDFPNIKWGVCEDCLGWKKTKFEKKTLKGLFR